MGNLTFLGAVLQGLEGPSISSIEFAKTGWKYTSMTSPAHRIAQSSLHAAICAPFLCNIDESIRIHECSYEHSKLANFPSYQGYAILFQIQQKLHFSVPLDDVLQTLILHYPYCAKMNIAHLTVPLQTIYDSVHMLVDLSSNHPLPGDYPRMPEGELYQNSYPPLVRVHAYQWVRTYYIMDDVVHLKYATDQLQQILPEVKGIPGSFEGPFMLCLARLRLFNRTTDDWNTLELLIEENIKQFQHYSSLNAANFLCKLKLLEAEFFRVTHSEDITQHLATLLEIYETAIEAAEETNQLYIAAIASEQAYKVCEKRNLKVPAKGYLSRAISYYQLWGASGKATTLAQAVKTSASTRTSISLHNTSTEDSARSAVSDLILTEATKLLSSDGEPHKIIQVISSLIQSHAGADRGMIIFKDTSDKLYILSYWNRVQEDIIVYPLPQEPASQLFLPSNEQQVPYDKIINVINSGEMLSESNDSTQFTNAKSVCCLPIKSRGVTKGVAYLENSLIPAAFPESQILMLDHLVGQIAGSIEREQLRIMLENTVSEVQKQNEMLLHFDKLKNHFVASASHELRTPLNAVLGFTEILLNSALTEQQKMYCDLINSSAEGLLAVINDILDFQRLQRGSIDLSLTNFSLHRSVDEVIRLLSLNEHTCTNQIQLHLDYIIKDEIIIGGDRVRLQQVLLKLLQNGIKFTPSGDVILRIAEKPTTSPDEITVHFEVEDTGIGIHPDQRSSLFQPFTQLDRGTDRKYDGAGLGLTLAQNILRAMSDGNSAIDYHSVLSEGTTFWFDISFRLTSRSPNIKQLLQSYLNQSDIVLACSNRFTIDSFTHLFNLDKLKTKIMSFHEMVQLEFSSETGLCCIDIDSYPIPDDFNFSEFCNQLPKGWFVVLIASALQRNQFLFSSLKYCVLIKPFCSQAIQTLDSLVCEYYNINSYVAQKEHAWKGRIRVMMVEDNKMNQRVQQKLLSLLKVPCDLAANGKVAIEMYIKARNDGTPYDLILMDCHMPEMDGFEATRKIRDHEKGTGSHVHICALTAGYEFDLCKSSGMCDVLKKPIRKDLFRAYFDSLFSTPSSCTFKILENDSNY